MAVVPDRNDDQVKVTGARLTNIVQHRECFDGGLGRLEHKPGTGPIYTSTPGSAGTIGTVDPKTGFVTPIGNFFGNSLSGSITEIEWSPDGKTLYATSGGGDYAIYIIDAHSGEILNRTSLTGFGAGGAINGLEFDPSGTLLGTHISTGGGAPSTLVSIIPDTGVVTAIGLTGYVTIGGIAFHPSTGILYGITSGGSIAELVTIVPGTGVATSVGLVFGIYSPIEMSSLEFDAEGRLISGGDDGLLYEIDTSAGTGTLIGPLGGNVTKISGLSMQPIFSGPRVHDHGITDKDFVAQSAQRALRQDVRPTGGSPQVSFKKNIGGVFLSAGRKFLTAFCTGPLSVALSTPATYDGSLSTGFDGLTQDGIVSYSWEIEDATFISGTGPTDATVVVDWGISGSKKVTLRVFDDIGRHDMVSKIVTVS